MDTIAKKKLSSQYFKTDYSHLERIASVTKSFNVIAAYLALARHADRHNSAEPYRFSGAGVKAIRCYCCVGHNEAVLLLKKLNQHGFISSLKPHEVVPNCRHILRHDNAELALPYMISGLTTEQGKHAADPVLRRLKKQTADEKLRLDALMVLINMYRSDVLNMKTYGGLSPNESIFAPWNIELTNQSDVTVRLDAYPNQEQATHKFIQSCLQYRLSSPAKKLSDSNISDFWAALAELRRLGLVYGAITLFYKQAAVFTLRVADYHASQKNEPSYMSALFKISGTYDQFYETEASPEGWESNVEEKIRVILPMVEDIEQMQVIKVCRPRFRMANKDASEWIGREQSIIETYSAWAVSDNEAYGYGET